MKTSSKHKNPRINRISQYFGPFSSLLRRLAILTTCPYSLFVACHKQAGEMVIIPLSSLVPLKYLTFILNASSQSISGDFDCR